MQTTLNINGMTCNGCAANLQKALMRVAGVEKAEVSFADKTATIQHHPETAPIKALEIAVDEAGFDVSH